MGDFWQFFLVPDIDADGKISFFRTQRTIVSGGFYKVYLNLSDPEYRNFMLTVV